MNLTPTLPQELIDTIISHLDPSNSNDFATLLLLNTVSRVTRAKSQEMIFERVELGWRSPLKQRQRERRDNNCSMFLEILERCERLGGVVKELVVENYVPDVDLNPSCPGWIHDEPALPIILSALRNLEKVEVRSWNVEIASFGEALKGAFGKVMRMGTVRCARFVTGMGFGFGEGFEELVRVVGGCLTLKCLSVASWSFDRPCWCSEQVTHLPRLESLQLMGPTTKLVAAMLLDVQSELRVDVMSVKALSLDLRKTSLEDEVVGEFWRRVKGTVEDLTLVISLFRPDTLPVSFDSFLHLRRFTLHIDVLVHHLDVHSLLEPLTQIINAANAEHLNIIVDLKYVPVDHISYTKGVSQWRKLDEMLKENNGQVIFLLYGLLPASRRVVEEYFGCGVTKVDERRTTVCLGV